MAWGLQFRSLGFRGFRASRALPAGSLLTLGLRVLGIGPRVDPAGLSLRCCVCNNVAYRDG